MPTNPANLEVREHILGAVLAKHPGFQRLESAKAHVAAILVKLEVADRTEAVSRTIAPELLKS